MSEIPKNPNCYICQNLQDPLDNGLGGGYHVAHGGYGVTCPVSYEQYQEWIKAIDDPKSNWDIG